ncbi:MAG: hypothetical protein HQK76_07795 [Desulfobacterales bacterium]|nr:hypothetical protein [Desulfobacterales bacterium]
MLTAINVTVLNSLNGKKAIEAMQKLKGSGNGNLINALLSERGKMRCVL